MLYSVRENDLESQSAFYEYFLAIDIQKGETLNSAILRSETFKEWRQGYEETIDFNENELKIINIVSEQQLQNGNKVI